MNDKNLLAIQGGTLSRTRKNPPAFPGEMAMDEIISGLRKVLIQ